MSERTGDHLAGGSGEAGEDGVAVDESTRKRLGHGARDMAWSLAVLLAIVGVLTWILGSCQLSPGGPSVDPGAVPDVDADRELARMARRVDFPLRTPELDEAWRATSANMSTASGQDGDRIVRVGWVTPEGEYARLAQSPAVASFVVADEADGVSQEVEPAGSVDIGSRAWAVYPAHEQEQAWVTSIDGVRVMVTGSAGEQELRTLAEAVQVADPS
ncbi:Protein of unknown function [Haloechinothrix alba]|uniref:DUF4245 domain-containing protein n=1 Tax=Haloechinothrix alba TaxID=664784 RepID=A0A238VDI0_9PSEU|nr:DUF4245 domain-containing protein [Haloechinothrix alba]SNR32208.1 Protein of unknown function [Haloechinothrix alba]